MRDLCNCIYFIFYFMHFLNYRTKEELVYLFSVVWFERECSGQHITVACILGKVLHSLNWGILWWRWVLILMHRKSCKEGSIRIQANRLLGAGLTHRPADFQPGCFVIRVPNCKGWKLWQICAGVMTLVLLCVCEYWFPAFWGHLEFQVCLWEAGITDLSDCSRIYISYQHGVFPFSLQNLWTIQKKFSKKFSLTIMYCPGAAYWCKMPAHSERDLLRNQCQHKLT